MIKRQLKHLNIRIRLLEKMALPVAQKAWGAMIVARPKEWFSAIQLKKMIKYLTNA